MTLYLLHCKFHLHISDMISKEMIFFFPPNSFPIDEKMNMKSVVDYFLEMYGYTIMYSHLPCLQVGSQNKVNYLPMEVSF